MGMDPFRHEEKGRLGQIDRKKTEEENKKQKKQKTRATFHGTDRKGLGEPGQGRRMMKNDFQKWQNRVPPK